MILTHDSLRLALTAACVLSYGLVCLAPWLRARGKRRAAGQADAAAARAPGWIVAYASQTGNAEELAEQTVETLRLASIPARLCELSSLKEKDLASAERILFIASTYGEGDAPDGAAAFASRMMTRSLPLPQLHYAVLALGDMSYIRYCGFGRALDQWLQEQGAQSLFERIDVNCNAAPAIAAWRHQLSHLAGTSDAPDWSAPAFDGWRLAARQQLNAGSSGAPVFHIELEPRDGALPDWQAGDLAQVAAPSDPSRAREYSIASVPADGRVHLLVRLYSHPDGSHGHASGWLGLQARVGETVQLRLRQHRRFRLEGNAGRPLILIGNGSGIAGLRGHLRARALSGQVRNWLLFGERHSAHDFHYRDEIAAWQNAGQLPELDLAWSRDGAAQRYVQDLLPTRAERLRAWVEQGAAIYVCGSLEGMAAGVDQALATLLGRPALERLAAEGRYRRDVY
jgi:sulfite reductase (NADPH) flavoprotein alpha-component